jgi:hypothetical protein
MIIKTIVMLEHWPHEVHISRGTGIIVETCGIVSKSKKPKVQLFESRESFRTSASEHAWCGASPQAIAETYDMTWVYTEMPFGPFGDINGFVGVTPTLVL